MILGRCIANIVHLVVLIWCITDAPYQVSIYTIPQVYVAGIMVLNSAKDGISLGSYGFCKAFF